MNSFSLKIGGVTSTQASGGFLDAKLETTCDP